MSEVSELEVSASVFAPSTESDSPRPSAPQRRKAPISPLMERLEQMQQAFDAVIQNQTAQNNLLETTVNMLRETAQEMRDTLEVQQRVIAEADDQADKLTDVTEALITVTAALQQLLQR